MRTIRLTLRLCSWIQDGCHPERGEGSRSLTSAMTGSAIGRNQIPRFARNDKFESAHNSVHNDKLE